MSPPRSHRCCHAPGRGRLCRRLSARQRLQPRRQPRGARPRSALRRRRKSRSSTVTSAEAKRLAAVLERSIVDDKLDTGHRRGAAKADRRRMPRLYRAHRGRRAVQPGAEEFDFRHRCHGHGERIVTCRRSRGLRARHVAELDGALDRLERLERQEKHYGSHR